MNLQEFEDKVFSVFGIVFMIFVIFFLSTCMIGFIGCLLGGFICH
ncbi:MAG: hypothetical protein WC254_07695 [Candidatus Woesearchaeota archaeon]|jgi:hypothetical protein